MIEFIFTMIFILITTWIFSCASTSIRQGKHEDFGSISKRRKKALIVLIKTPGTRTFLISVLIAMIGITIITNMMHGNLRGIIYPTWQRNIGFILFGQLILVLIWYLWFKVTKPFNKIIKEIK